MISALKAEFRKLFTVRSTYVLIIVALLFDIFLAGFVKGYQFQGSQPGDIWTLQSSMIVAVSITSVFVAIIALLLITHEYRYNTILYSMTANRSRTVLLFSKFIAITVFSLVITVMLAGLAPLMTYIGAGLGGHDLVSQHFAWGDIVWKILFYGWGTSIIALLIGVLIRSQIGAIVIYFLMPTTIEGLLSLLLKENVAYLPFTSLGIVIDKSQVLTSAEAAMVFIGYMVIGWAVAWALFLKRDAN